MGKPIALLIGVVENARKDWEALEDVAELRELTEGTREQFFQDCDNGVYDGVLAIYRTFYSISITGRLDAEFVSHLPSSVKFICHNGAGYDQIDIPPCTSRGITVSHTPKAVDAATADTALLLLLSALRHAWIPSSNLRAGKWRGDDFPLGHDPEGKVLGILGMGGIGTATALRAKAFEMEIVYHNRRPVAEGANLAKAEYVPDLDEFWRRCDVVSVHLPLNSGTRHFIGREELRKMKDGVVIVNTARGPVIDEEALVEALESGKVGSVGLDVFEREPEVHPGLVGNKRVALLPHIGTSTWETQYKMEKLVVDNVRSAVTEGRLLTVVPEQRE
ncbi:hypothetical protein EX30DRAFT_26274 [Ascodesmis nigricans]|uniref:Glyoxylate reductase n=1 Tax=Ascodesmis nigricans TaxID=341454 RepID=A0A4S2N853_9PEZI|nr:hypothetical protein EX30DRAFT_26274 [Ascodesmis nigricans]